MENRKKLAVITGANRGLGKATAQLFIEKGYHVVSLARNPSEWCSNTDKLTGYICDTRDRTRLEEVKEDIISRFGRVDVLVNNAGVHGCWRDYIENFPDDNWDMNVSINLTGTYNCTKIIGGTMIGDGLGGAIVNISSMDGLAPIAGSVSYCTTKRAVTMLTECTALEWGQYGVRCNCICPGSVETEINRSRFESPGVREGRAKLTALKRNGRPEDIAQAVYFLASDAASWITGETLSVDGGMKITTLVPFTNLS